MQNNILKSTTVEPSLKQDGYWHIPHHIPLGSLVEVTEGEYKGIRLYVVNLARDADGTPLYELHFDTQIIYSIASLKEELMICSEESSAKQLHKIYAQLLIDIKEHQLRMI